MLLPFYVEIAQEICYEYGIIRTPISSRSTYANRSTFFTNASGYTLLDRFRKTLKDVKFFDVLVGYFCTSGFYNIYKSFEPLVKIRMLEIKACPSGKLHAKVYISRFCEGDQNKGTKKTSEGGSGSGFVPCRQTFNSNEHI